MAASDRFGDLRQLFDREDFKHVWNSVATQIKIRKFEQVNDIPEVQELSIKLHQRVLYAVKNMKQNYDAFTDGGYFYNTDLIELHSKGEENWIGVFQYNYATMLTKVAAILLGLSVNIGGVYYFWNVAPKHVASLTGYIVKNWEKVQDWIIGLAGTIFTELALIQFKKWLLNDNSAFNMVVAACILKKLEMFRGDQRH